MLLHIPTDTLQIVASFLTNKDIANISLIDKYLYCISKHLFIFNPKSFLIACRCGYVAIVDEFLNRPAFGSGVVPIRVEVDDLVNNYLEVSLVEACTSNNTQVACLIIAKTNASLSFLYNRPLTISLKTGNMLIANALLYSGRIDLISPHNNDGPMGIALHNKDEVLIHRLLDLGVDPSEANDYILKHSIRLGLLSVVERLLKDSRVKPNITCRSMIERALESGHRDVACLVLLDGRTPIERGCGSAIYLACTEGYTDVVRLLVNYSGVNVGDYDNICIVEAARKGYYDIVKILLGSSNADPTARGNMALKVAIDNSNEDIVRLLLNDVRVGNSYNIRRASIVLSYKHL